MGKLTITGKASHEYSYDLMEITVRFQAHEQTSAASMEKVLAQCEEFLSLMHEEGISADSIRIGVSGTGGSGGVLPAAVAGGDGCGRTSGGGADHRRRGICGTVCRKTEKTIICERGHAVGVVLSLSSHRE